MSFLDNLLFSLSTTLPILFWLVGGYALRRAGRLGDGFVADGNRLVFTWCLPALLFLNIARAPLTEVWQGDLIGYAVLFTLASIAVLWWSTPNLSSDNPSRGVFIQGAFRGNMGIVGLAMVVNAFGASAVPLASLYLAMLTLLYNIASVVVLQMGQGNSLAPWPLLKQIMRNPLMVAVLLGIGWSLTGLPLPELADNTLQGLADLALPMALLCVGASLRLHSLRGHRNLVLGASMLKLVILPTLAVVGGVLLGFRGEPLGILYLMMAAPTAAASFVMARAMTQWGELAAEIIVITTLLSLISTTVGLFVLRGFGLV